jgi:hypothetical protein
MKLHVLEANYYASKVAVENGHDVVDLHYFLRHQIHRRAEDGIHLGYDRTPKDNKFSIDTYCSNLGY